MPLYPFLAILFFSLLRRKPQYICYPGCGRLVRNPSNIRLTFKPRSRAERGIGVVLAPSSRKNHDKVVYKVETVVRIAHFYKLSQVSYLCTSNKGFASPDIMI